MCYVATNEENRQVATEKQNRNVLRAIKDSCQDSSPRVVKLNVISVAANPCAI